MKILQLLSVLFVSALIVVACDKENEEKEVTFAASKIKAESRQTVIPALKEPGTDFFKPLL